MQEDAAKLLVAYSGDKAREIQDREAEVVNAWRNLQINMEYRKNLLGDTADLFKFFSLVRDLMLWMEDMVRQMTTQEKPRYNYFYLKQLEVQKASSENVFPLFVCWY